MMVLFTEVKKTKREVREGFRILFGYVIFQLSMRKPRRDIISLASCVILEVRIGNGLKK